MIDAKTEEKLQTADVGATDAVIYHFHARIISRGSGQSAVAKSAYNSGENYRDDQGGGNRFFSTRQCRILELFIMAPKDAPEWAYDRAELWNRAEAAEKRKDGQLAREIEVSLPHVLTHEQRVWLAKDFARAVVVRQGFVADIAIHAPDNGADDRNFHAHILFTMRQLVGDNFAKTRTANRDMNAKDQLLDWRRRWADLANYHLERHGHVARVDWRTLDAQGIDRAPDQHTG